MKRYRLLRDNNDAGPFLQGELKSLGLYTTDLIWIEEESTCWTHPADIEELKPFVRKRPARSVAPSHCSPALVSERPLLQHAGNEISGPAASVTENYFSQTKEKIEFRSRPKKFDPSAITANLFGMGVLLVGVMLAAFVVKKIVDHFEDEPIVASANAVEITNEILPVNTGSYAAKSLSQTINANLASPIVTQTDTADSMFVQAKSPEPVAMKAKSTPTQTEAEKPLPSLANNTEGQNEAANTTAAEQQTQIAEVAEAPKKAPSINLSANDYKVGVFGGVSGLEITVNNLSSSAVAKATVEVEFLKPNGNVVKSQTMTVENISPGGTKKISVPSSNRGVNVRYKIVGVEG